MSRLLTTKSFDEMQDYLTEPTTRIVDSRMLEDFNTFAFTLQILNIDGTIFQTVVVPKFIALESGEVQTQDMAQFRKEALELFRLQYRNSPRMNPALYGLLDAADAESRVEQSQIM